MKFFTLIVVSFLLLGCPENIPDPVITKTLFSYHSDSAKTVYVAGSFNNWSPDTDSMSYYGNGRWSIKLELIPNYYQYKFVVDGNWITDPNNEWMINDGGDNYNSIIKAGNPAIPERKKSQHPFPKDQLPTPVIENRPELVKLYYTAWEMAWNKIQQGTPKNDFESLYMDEGFNELIYQWDLCFITSFAVYGSHVYPVMPSLDNLYKKQKSDGYIQRVYWETDGTLANEPSKEEPMVNPPLFAWVEWRYYTITGDDSRFKHVLPVLIKYYEWVEQNCAATHGAGLFYNTPLGSGMDNTPRPNVHQAAYIDYSAQQALAAMYIAKIAQAENDLHIYDRFKNKHQVIKKSINQSLWNQNTKFYYDLTVSDSLSSTMHIGAYWTLLADVITEERLPAMLTHLTNPNEFWRPHLVPTLAANQPQYDPKGHYWLGSIWAPTNYMLIKGLMNQGQYALADSVAFNHINNIADIYYNFVPDPDKIAFDERYADSYQTLWECYSPEYNTPATRWDNTFYSRQDFVGWTGLAPIALLIENVLGFDIVGSDNQINWTIKRTDRHGIKNLRLGDQTVSLIYEKSSLAVECKKPFVLDIVLDGETVRYEITESTVIEL